MENYGLIFPDGHKELASIVLDEDGNPRIDTMRPYPVPDGWQDPRIVPVIKIDKPQDGDWEPLVVWFDDRVERQWQPLNK